MRFKKTALAIAKTRVVSVVSVSVARYIKKCRDRKMDRLMSLDRNLLIINIIIIILISIPLSLTHSFLYLLSTDTDTTDTTPSGALKMRFFKSKVEYCQ